MPTGIPFLDAASTASDVLGGIFKGVESISQMNKANSIKLNNPVYTASPYAANQLDTVNQAYNGRMAGASSAEQAISNNFANSAGGVARNSTSGAQSLAVLAGLNGQADQSNVELAAKEAQNKQQLLGELGMANQGMTSENDKVYNDKLRNYNNDLAAKNALINASMQNKGAMVSDFGDSLIGVGGIASSISGGSGMNNGTGYSTGQGPYGVIPGMTNSTGYINPFINTPTISSN